MRGNLEINLPFWERSAEGQIDGGMVTWYKDQNTVELRPRVVCANEKLLYQCSSHPYNHVPSRLCKARSPWPPAPPAPPPVPPPSPGLPPYSPGAITEGIHIGQGYCRVNRATSESFGFCLSPAECKYHCYNRTAPMQEPWLRSGRDERLTLSPEKGNCNGVVVTTDPENTSGCPEHFCGMYFDTTGTRITEVNDSPGISCFSMP